jgi:hypothetical protein
MPGLSAFAHPNARQSRLIREATAAAARDPHLPADVGSRT